jgi:DNA polymerase-1
MMAMIKLWRSEVLRSLKWRLLLQIHDEVILEGPIETQDIVSIGYICGF